MVKQYMYKHIFKTCIENINDWRNRTVNALQKVVLLSIASPNSTSLHSGLSILKTSIKAILIMLFAGPALAQNSAQTCISWQTILGEEGLDERATDIQYNPKDESFWVCGYKTSSYQIGADNSKNAWLFQINKQGELISDFVLNDSTELIASTLAHQNENLFIGGYYHSTNKPTEKKAWLSFCKGSDIEWMFKNTRLGETKDILQLSNGDLLTTGYINFEDTLRKSVIIERWRTDATLVWSKTYGGSKDDEGNALCLLDDNTVLVTGFTSSFDADVSNLIGGRDVWLLAIDVETGMLLKEKTFGGTSNDVAVDIDVLPNKQIAFLSESLSSNGDISNSIGNGDFWLAMLNENWEIIWEQSYGGLDSDFPQSLEIFPEGDLLISGTSFSSNGDIKTNYGFLDSWVARIDQSDGSIIWNKVIGGNDLDQVASLSIYNDTKIALAGNTDSYNIECKTKDNKHANQNVWLFGLDEMLLDTDNPPLEIEAAFTYFINNPYVHIQNNSSQMMNVLITDISGKTYFRAAVLPSQKQSVYFADWKKGIYPIIYTHDSEVPKVKKVGLF